MAGLDPAISLIHQPMIPDFRVRMPPRKRRSNGLIKLLEGFVESASLPERNGLRQSRRTSRIVIAMPVCHLPISKTD